MMEILMSETCWAHKKWNKTASHIKLVFHSSTITMMHGPTNSKSFHILFSSGTEHVIWNFFTILYTVLSHGAGYVIFFRGGGVGTRQSDYSWYICALHVHAASEHALLNRKHFPHTLTCSIQDTAHNWMSITSVSTDKMIQLATKLPCLTKLMFPCALRTNKRHDA